jgi:hypothetical protein
MLSRTHVTHCLTVLFLSIIALTLTTPAFASSFHIGAGTFTGFDADMIGNMTTR